MTFSLRETNRTTAKYEIVWLSLKVNQTNCKSNHTSTYLFLEVATIFQYSNHRCIGIIIYYIVTHYQELFHCKLILPLNSHFYSNQRCIGNIIYYIVTLPRIVPLLEIKNTTRYKILRLSLEFHPMNCKGSHMPLCMNMNDGTIFKYSILRCIGNTIYILVIFSRVVPIRATKNTKKRYNCLSVLGITSMELQW